MQNIWYESGRIDKELQNQFIPDFIEIYGAVGTCKRLMQNGGPERVQPNLTKLWKVGRLDLTVESIIANDNYKLLFDERTKFIAAERLKRIIM